MIVEIERPKESCLGALDYNEEKVMEGVAELVAYANIGAPDHDAVYDCFSRYEKTPYPIRLMRFHASVNPSENDLCSEEQVLDFICSMMEKLGYGEQPYLVYRHFDIDREHYHVVSVRADKDGRKIQDRYEHRRLREFMKAVSASYDFSVAESGSGRMGEEQSESFDPKRVRRYNPRGKVTSQLTDIFRTALGYDFGTFSQFACIMEDFGVRAQLLQTDGKPVVALQGLAKDGRAASATLTQTDLGVPMYSLIEDRMEENGLRHGRRHREKERVRSLTSSAFNFSRSENHFVNILATKGIRVHLSRSEETGKIFGITLVDHRTRTVFKASEMPEAISVRSMETAVAAGVWRVERTGSRRERVREIQGAMREESVQFRNLRVGSTARLLKPMGQPNGSSWSGRSGKSETQRRDEFEAGKTGSINASFEDKSYKEKLAP